ncbi:oligosaccharide flippase family protein [Nocardioides sp. zg-DK7169]|uniref:oligosaccharide flippase family protein n=1 Tax=Nocardioides sp. zg-DK7169 TaxID=2736600 RepID=UPI0015544679|nr:oligosaccharide flippase family protein [Nocardioides sp. zg-DK7169]NPC97944.1 oligosaccharide flippase family protein [Nocardioides sp. zg-DK7169]
MSTEAASRAARIGRGLGWSLTGNVALRFGNVAVSILMARLIAPDELGVFAVALTIWAILGTLAEFGLGADLVRASDPERRAPTVASLGVLISAILALSMVLAAGPLAAAFRSPESRGVIVVMALGIAVFGFSIVPAARLQREFRQGTLFAVNGAGLLASALVMTTLALRDVGPAALAWGQVANQVVVVLGLHLATRSRPRFGLDREIARASLAFCLPLALANLVSWALLSIDNLIVARVLGPGELGLYLLAFNVSSWPMSAVGQALRVVALPGFAQVADPGERNRALLRSVAPAAAVAALMGLTLATLAGPLVAVLYGERWSGAAAALTGLAVFGALRVLLDLVATFLIAIGATTAVLAVQVLWMAALVPAMYVGLAGFGLAGAGWSHVVVTVAVVIPAYGVCLRRAGVDTGAFLRAGLVPLAVAVPAAAACWWAGARSGPPLLVLVLGCLVALAAYALPLGSWWLRRINDLRRPDAHRPDPVRLTRGSTT